MILNFRSLKVGHKKRKTGALKYEIGKFKCILPPVHKLPIYQVIYPTYDNYYGNWLRIIEKKLKKEINMLDIGANVGDTALYVLSFINAHITAVEPSSYFYNYLEQNLELNNLTSSVKPHKLALVLDSSDEGELLLYSDGSTASTTINRQAKHTNTEKVSSILFENFLTRENKVFDLVKIDIDSNDFEYILRIISNPFTEKAIICFEFDPLSLNNKELEDAWLAFRRIEELRYTVIIVDNHGRTMMSTHLIQDTLQYFAHWIYIQSNSKNQHVHYFDIWLFPPIALSGYSEISKVILAK